MLTFATSFNDSSNDLVIKNFQSLYARYTQCVNWYWFSHLTLARLYCICLWFNTNEYVFLCMYAIQAIASSTMIAFRSPLPKHFFISLYIFPYRSIHSASFTQVIITKNHLLFENISSPKYVDCDVLSAVVLCIRCMTLPFFSSIVMVDVKLIIVFMWMMWWLTSMRALFKSYVYTRIKDRLYLRFRWRRYPNQAYLW